MNMKVISTIKKIQTKIKDSLDVIIEKLALHLVYLIGVGLTQLFAKLLNKKFIDKRISVSSWKTHISLGNSEKMY